MPDRQLPVRPDLDQLRHQAKDLLRAIRSAEPAALAEFERNRGSSVPPSAAKLSDAQLALARSYGLPSWPRLVTACRMTDAIWRNDAATIRALVLKDPRLLSEDARGVKGNWGPPMSYAANLGRDSIVEMLRAIGADDVQFAFERACLQGKLQTARLLHSMGGRPLLGSVMGPCETQSGDGLALLLELGAVLADEHGDRLAPLCYLLQTYSRNPAGKHRCLELAAVQGVTLPDTPTMAIHRGRIDLLAAQLRRDPDLLTRTFTHDEIWPPELGCQPDHTHEFHYGAPLAGATLLHLCVDGDEIEIARWLLAQGMHPDANAAVDADGFGGHTALHGCVVAQPYRVRLRTDDAFARLLLDHGADPNLRASLRKRRYEDGTMREYRDVTPLTWGESFHDQNWVSPSVMKLVAERGGHA